MINCKFDLAKFVICIAGILMCTFFIMTHDNYYFPHEEHRHYLYINTTQPIFETDDEFLSIALDTSFMRESFNKLNNSDWELLAKYAKQLSPGYLRLGGTAADRVMFLVNDNDGIKSDKMKSNPQTGNDPDYLYISGQDWIKFTNFVNKTGLKLILDLNVLLRNGTEWDSRNAKEWMSFSEAHNLSMDFQLGNEPNSFEHVFNISISGEQLGKDYSSLREILLQSVKYKKSKLVGPEVTRPKFLEEPSIRYLKDFLSSAPDMSAVTWHQYYLNGRTATLNQFTDPKVYDVLIKEINAVNAVVRQFSSDVPVWLSETSSAYGGGAPGLSNRFVGSFLWLDKLGVAAKSGLKVVVRQSLYQSYYSLIDDEFYPLPDYWISVVYKLLVGRKVLKVDFAKQHTERRLRLYCSCLKLSETINGSVVLYGLNLGNQTMSLIPGGLKNILPYTSLIFTAENNNLTSKYILLNGKRLQPDDEPITEKIFDNVPEPTLPLSMPPFSMAFWIFYGMKEGTCEFT